jgi:phosphonoacetaldehyde hydrolase
MSLKTDFVYRRSYRGPVRAAVLDLAGTVADFGSRAPAFAFVELFKRHGITVTPSEARGPMGLNKRDHIGALLELPGIADQWRDSNGADWAEADLDALYAEFVPLQVEILPDYGELVPGAPEAVSELRQRGVAIAGTTGYNREMLDVVLHSASKQGVSFDAALCAAEVPAGRPAPWLIHGCMQALGVYPAEAVVKVGDTLPDITAGLNAGAWTVGAVASGNMAGLSREEYEGLSQEEKEAVCQPGAEAMRRAGAHFVIETIASLPRVIDDIDRRLLEGERP